MMLVLVTVSASQLSDRLAALEKVVASLELEGPDAPSAVLGGKCSTVAPEDRYECCTPKPLGWDSSCDKIMKRKFEGEGITPRPASALPIVLHEKSAAAAALLPAARNLSSLELEPSLEGQVRAEAATAAATELTTEEKIDAIEETALTSLAMRRLMNDTHLYMAGLEDRYAYFVTVTATDLDRRLAPLPRGCAAADLAPSSARTRATCPHRYARRYCTRTGGRSRRSTRRTRSRSPTRQPTPPSPSAAPPPPLPPGCSRSPHR